MSVEDMTIQDSSQARSKNSDSRAQIIILDEARPYLNVSQCLIDQHLQRPQS